MKKCNASGACSRPPPSDELKGARCCMEQLPRRNPDGAGAASALPAEARAGTETASEATATTHSARNARSTWKEHSTRRLRLPAASADPAEARVDPES